MRKVILAGLFSLMILPLWSVSASAATTVTGTHTVNSQTIGRYQKFEVTFDISRTFGNTTDYTSMEYYMLPYYYYDATDTQPITAFPNPGPVGANGITVDAYFTSPSGRQLVVPAFYMQNYTRGTGYRINLQNSYDWKVRFAPEEVGQYQYYISITDKTGTSRYPTQGTLNFQSTASSSKGFVKKSVTDPRFFQFSNGDSFVPNGAAAQWWRDGRSDGYEKTFAAFKNNNINFTRVWDQNDGYGLTVEGPYDAYPDNYPEAWGLANKDPEAIQVKKGTQMNQRGNAEEDIIIDSAQNNGVYIQLCAHGDAYWIWDASVHNEGWNLNKSAFDSTKHLDYWKRNYRYRIARWGYSTAIMGWEVWNEHSHVSVGSTTYNFYQTLATYVKQADPYDHLFTTSQGSQAWSPGLWGSTAMDYSNYHDYMMASRYPSGLYNDATRFVYSFAQCLRTTNGRASGCSLGIGDGSTWSSPNSKPIIWGELDTGTNNWNESNPQPTARLNMRWAGLFSPVGMAPVDWYDLSTSSSFNQAKYAEAKIAGSFFADIPYDKYKFTYLATSDVAITSGTVNTTNSKLRVLAMRSEDTQHLYAYAQHSDFKWANGTTVPSAISGNFTVTGMTNGTYNIEYWDTTSGAKSTATATASGGSITVPVNSLSKSVAIKIIKDGATPPPPPPTGTCAADINEDNVVDLSDYSLLIRDFLKASPLNPRSDINTDGVVDLTDYSLLVRDFLKSCN